MGWNRQALLLGLLGISLIALIPASSAALQMARVRLPDDPSKVFSDSYFDVTEYITQSSSSSSSSTSSPRRSSPFARASLAESTARTAVSSQSQVSAQSHAQSQAEAQLGSQAAASVSAQSLNFASFAKGLGNAVASGASSMLNGFLQQNGPTPGDVEDCMACQFVWAQVEMDVGNTQLQQAVYDTFHRNCAVAGKTPIFYPACQAMADMVDDLIGDYIQGHSVSQICTQNFLCREVLRRRS